MKKTDETIELKRPVKWMHRNKKKYLALKAGDRRKFNKKPETSYLVSMKYHNGTRKNFVVTPKDGTFKIKKQTYYVDNLNLWYNTSMQQYELEYIEDCPAPITKEVQFKDKDNAFNIVNPSMLSSLIKAEYIKTMVNVGDLTKMMKALIGLTALNLIAVIIVIFNVFKGA